MTVPDSSHKLMQLKVRSVSARCADTSPQTCWYSECSSLSTQFETPEWHRRHTGAGLWAITRHRHQYATRVSNSTSGLWMNIEDTTKQHNANVKHSNKSFDRQLTKIILKRYRFIQHAGWLTEVFRPTRRKTGHFGDVIQFSFST